MVKTTKTKVVIAVEFETVYLMTDREAEDRAIKYITGQLNAFTMAGLYGIVKVADQVDVSRSEGSER